MAYSTPPNFVAGAVLTEANLDVLSDDISFLANPPRCRVYNSGNLSIATSTWTALTLDSERYDTDTMHSTAVNTSRITFTTAGTYLVGAHVIFDVNATGVRGLRLVLGGSTPLAEQMIGSFGGLNPSLSIATAYQFTAGQYVEMQAYQSSGGNLNVLGGVGNQTPEFWAHLVAVA